MPPGCDMTSKKTLNTKNLEALGAERLAELLIEICKGRPAARRLLRLELAGAQGTAELAREVRHRMATIRRSRALIDSRRRRDLVDDLELCRRTIVDRIAVEDAAEALDLMWQYMGLANPIQSAFPRKIYISLKYWRLFLMCPSDSQLSQNPSSNRMQIFSNSGPFLSAFGVAWRFSPDNAASMRTAIQHATVIVSDAAIRSCDWPAGRAAGSPCSPYRNAHAPRRS